MTIDSEDAIARSIREASSHAAFAAQEKTHTELCTDLADALGLPWNAMCWRDMVSYVRVLRQLRHLAEQDPVQQMDACGAAADDSSP